MSCAKYFPLDATLELLSVRALRALRHFDGATAAELALALDEPNADEIRWVLRYHRLRGRIEQRRDDPTTTDPRYFVTASGLRWVERMLRRGELAAFQRVERAEAR